MGRNMQVIPGSALLLASAIVITATSSFVITVAATTA